MNRKTLLTEELEQAKNRVKLDNQCKRLLSIKIVLAHILKGCVREFKNYSINEIIACIESEPVVSETPVNYTKSAGDKRISGLSSECSQTNESDIRFDIRFKVRTAPKDKNIKSELFEIIINIEAQNKYQPSISGDNVKHSTYHLTSRGVYYVCRQISSQYGEEFVNSDYDSIKKVYTIFICNNVPKRRQNTISRYHITEEDVVGHVREKKKYYDLMEVILVRLGEDDEEKILKYAKDTDLSEGDDDGKDALRFLRVLLAGNVKVGKKLNILKKEFNIDPTIKEYDKLTKEVDHMCDISEGIYSNALNRGWNEGMKQGMKQGIKRGVEQGREIGITNLITSLEEFGVSKDDIVNKLCEKYHLTKSNAGKYVENILNKDEQRSEY